MWRLRFEEGHNCWQVAHAARLAVLVDGEAYFAAIRRALLAARRRARSEQKVSRQAECTRAPERVEKVGRNELRAHAGRRSRLKAVITSLRSGLLRNQRRACNLRPPPSSID